MNLSPTAANAGKLIGHRRGRSSAVDIRISTVDEPQEKETTQPLLLVESHDEDGKYEYDRSSSPRRTNSTFIAVSWIASLLLTALVTYLVTKSPSPRAQGSFASGFLTELKAARSAIRIRPQQFHGSLDFNGHHGFIPPGSPSLAYVGSTPDVDEAWETLSKDRYFLLTDDEAREAYGAADIGKYWNVHHGGYIAGLDVLHSLHCLNHLRMSLYPKVYPQDPVDGPMHQAHCIDHMRQLLMCNADLTPVPTQYFVGLQRNYINSSRPHTCRDFSKVREWATERFNGSTAVKPRNRDGSPRANFYAPWSP